MPERKDIKTYVTVPNKGDHELNTLFETVNYLRQLVWTYKVWTPTPALIDKSGDSRQYVGQSFDPRYFDLVQDGWTHDHCEICYATISDIEDDGDKDGFNAESDDWICKDCYNLFIKPPDIGKTLNDLPKVFKP